MGSSLSYHYDDYMSSTKKISSSNKKNEYHKLNYNYCDDNSKNYEQQSSKDLWNNHNRSSSTSSLTCYYGYNIFQSRQKQEQISLSESLIKPMIIMIIILLCFGWMLKVICQYWNHKYYHDNNERRRTSTDGENNIINNNKLQLQRYNIKKECMLNGLNTQIYSDYIKEQKQDVDDINEHTKNGDDDQEHVCSICLLAYKDDDIIAKSHNEECSHIYHNECIVQWLLINKTECPNCRKPYITNTSCNNLSVLLGYLLVVLDYNNLLLVLLVYCTLTLLLAHSFVFVLNNVLLLLMMVLSLMWSYSGFGPI